MNSSKMIFKLMAAFALNIFAAFSVQADCPSVTDIIRAFNKNGLPPKNWSLISYTGNQVDNRFQLAQVSWNADSLQEKKLTGYVECEYHSNNKANPGFLIIQTDFPRPAPLGKNWLPSDSDLKTTICKPAGGASSNCHF
jgi:hypothetical protein